MRKTIVVLVTVLLMTAFISSCKTTAPADSDDAPPNQNEAQDIGQGSTVFEFQMVDENGEITAWNVHTDETIVGEALLAVGLIEGDVSEYGLMVTFVNGNRADFMEDGAYWAFYIDDEFAVIGVDATEIEQGIVYAFVYTKA